jgi:hypothetical protein
VVVVVCAAAASCVARQRWAALVSVVLRSVSLASSVCLSSAGRLGSLLRPWRVFADLALAACGLLLVLGPLPLPLLCRGCCRCSCCCVAVAVVLLPSCTFTSRAISVSLRI